MVHVLWSIHLTLVGTLFFPHIRILQDWHPQDSRFPVLDVPSVASRLPHIMSRLLQDMVQRQVHLLGLKAGPRVKLLCTGSDGWGVSTVLFISEQLMSFIDANAYLLGVCLLPLLEVSFNNSEVLLLGDAGNQTQGLLAHGQVMYC